MEATVRTPGGLIREVSVPSTRRISQTRTSISVSSGASGALTNLYACDGWRTSYEHEAWYNNYDGFLFLSSDVKAWSSNLPDAYLDTGFLDSPNELSMTIGTGAAYQLDTGVYYTTYIRTAPGNAASDTGKVNGQRGHNYCPIGFTGGWCVEGSATERLLPAWSHSAPGLTYWTHY